MKQNVSLRTIKYFKPYWKLLLLSAICSAIVGSMDAGIIALTKNVLEKILASKNTTIFLLIPPGIILLFLIRGVTRFTYDTSIKLAGQKAVQDIRNDMYSNNIRLDMAFYNRKATGEMMSHMTNDIGAMQDGIANIVTGLFRDLISVIALLGYLFYLNWRLALLSFIVIPLTAWPAKLIGKKIKNASGRSLNVMGGITAILQESFSGIKIIKAFGLENRALGRFRAANLDYYNQMRRFIKYESLATPVSELIISFGIAAVIYFGGSQVLADQMTAFDLIAFIGAMVMLSRPVNKLQGSYSTFQRSAGAAERVFSILDQSRKIVESDKAFILPRSQGTVEFRNVSFSYGDEPVLQNINLIANTNQMVALVGPSGGGKSTLVSLIPRFYDVTAGAVLIDGHDLRDVSLKSLVDNIALVDQETTLFNETIANNIRYGKPDASMQEVIEAARSAYAHEFIEQLPEGYETNIGDRGTRLSGGQRQRICIARALLKNAPILILDEATSALDTESEKMVQQALDNLMVNRTTFVIAHRLSTVMHADVIVVLEEGHIVEQGSHEDLLTSSGLYSRLHSLQFSDRDGDSKEP
ncbi:MAG TPA: ABC transporter transmembrane domain-containing protein [Deltaproteobacteria bacterium]|nr:ABC transporter transmembrane domain-containing protein [Deltaproteobacteria bacterium]